MIRIPAPLSAAGTATMTAVTASAQSITHTVSIVSALAETGAKHAEAYRDAQIETIELNRAERQAIAGEEARVRTAERLTVLQKKLNDDPLLADVYAQLGDQTFDVRSLLLQRQRPNLSVAAE